MESLWTTGHVVMLLVSGVTWVIGSVVLVRHVGVTAHRRSMKQFSLLLCVIAFAGLAINIFASGIPGLENRPGLAQRIAFAVWFAWYTMAASTFLPTTHRSAGASAA